MKGDYVEVVTAVGAGTQTTRLTASKLGRSVRTKWAGRWLYISEVARPSRANPEGRPTGNLVRVRQDSIVSVEERRVD